MTGRHTAPSGLMSTASPACGNKHTRLTKMSALPVVAWHVPHSISCHVVHNGTCYYWFTWLPFAADATCRLEGVVIFEMHNEPRVYTACIHPRNREHHVCLCAVNACGWYTWVLQQHTWCAQDVSKVEAIAPDITPLLYCTTPLLLSHCSCYCHA